MAEKWNTWGEGSNSGYIAKIFDTCYRKDKRSIVISGKLGTVTIRYPHDEHELDIRVGHDRIVIQRVSSLEEQLEGGQEDE